MTLLYSFYTEILLCLALVYFLMLKLLFRPFWNKKGFSFFVYHQLLLVLLVIVFALGCTEGHWHFVLQYQVPDEVFYPTPFLTSSFISFVAKVALVLLTMACVLLHSPTVAFRGQIAMDYAILILFITLASLLLLSASDLSFAFVAMELQTLSLIAFSFLGHQRKTVTAEAIFRYFANASFASVCFLFSVSLFYALTGVLHIEQLKVLLETQVLTTTNSFFVLVILAAVLLLFALFFKLTLAPFHHWVGDLYQGTSGYVGSYFTLVTKLPMWILLTKILSLFLIPAFSHLLFTIQWLAVFSIVIGNVYAFSENNFRRFWALSSVGHMGQILLAITLSGPESLLVATLYLLLYLSANIFFWAFLLQQEARPNFNLTPREFFSSIFRLFSLSESRLSLIFLFLMVSLAGVPPAFGFVAKFYLFFSLYQAQNFMLLAIVFFANLISLSYYLRLIRLVFFKHAGTSLPSQEKPFASWPSSIYGTFAFLFLLHSVFGFWLLQVVFSALVLFF